MIEGFPAADNGTASFKLDHRFYPHIVDLIFSSLSYTGLVACSAVCKEWRVQLRPHLFKHVAVFESVFCDETVVVRSRNLKRPQISAVLTASHPANVDALRNVQGCQTVDCGRSSLWTTSPLSARNSSSTHISSTADWFEGSATD